MHIEGSRLWNEPGRESGTGMPYGFFQVYASAPSLQQLSSITGKLGLGQNLVSLQFRPNQNTGPTLSTTVLISDDGEVAMPPYDEAVKPNVSYWLLAPDGNIYWASFNQTASGNPTCHLTTLAKRLPFQRSYAIAKLNQEQATRLLNKYPNLFPRTILPLETLDRMGSASAEELGQTPFVSAPNAFTGAHIREAYPHLTF